MILYQLLLLFVVALAATSSAQRVWTVGRSASHDFDDIPPAIAAAAPGDTIEVFSPFGVPGTPRPYSSTVLNKGIRLLCQNWAGYAGPIQIRDVPPGECVSIVGWVGTFWLSVANCRGRVIIDQCFNFDFSTLTVQRSEFYLCDDVLISGGELEDLRIVNSRILANHARFMGTPAIVQRGGDLTIHDSRAEAPSTSGAMMAGYDAIDMVGGVLRVSGAWQIIQGGTTWVRYGSLLIPFTGAGIRSDGGRVSIGAEVRISPLGGIPITGTSQFEFHSNPYFDWTGGSAYGFPQLDATLRGEPGAAVIVGLSLPGAPLATPFGELWLDTLLGSTQVVSVGTLDPTGSLRVQGDYSSVLSPGEALMLQAVVLSAQGLRLSSPFVYGVGI